MNNEQTFALHFAEGQKNAEITIREGKAPELLAPKAPVKLELSGTIGSVVEFLTKRIESEQFFQDDCHIIVNREKVTIELIVNEANAYKRGSVKGALQYNPKFVEFGINADKVWKPTELGLFFKMNRSFFESREANMKLVTELMNFTAKINTSIERSAKESGDRTDNFAQVVNSNLPSSFTLNIPIFKGLPIETIEIETFAQVSGREIAFVLLSPGAQCALEEIRDKCIDEQLTKIKDIAPDIVIIEE